MTERLLAIRHPAGPLTLAVETFGDRRDPAMVLIMGLGTQMLGWHDDLCRLLADTGHFVVRFDNRDVGRSTKFDAHPLPNLPWALLRLALGLPVATPYRLADMALDVVGLMDALRIGRAHIVGASMGGMIGQLLAAHHAERVCSFTCIMSSAGAPRLSDSAPRARRALLSRPKGRDRASLIEHEVDVRLACGGPLPPHRDDLRAWAARCLDRQDDTEGKQRQFLCAKASGSQLADVAKIRLPTLYLHGRDDPLIPPRQSQQLQAHTPGAELVLLRDMGHDLPRALWPELVQRIAAHCARARA